MDMNELSAERDEKYFKAFAKDKTLSRAEFNKKHPILPQKKPKGFAAMPRNFEIDAPSPKHKKLYDALAGYCKKFPQVNPPNLVFCGATGTGKTYTAQILCNILYDRGFNVHFTTAFGLTQSLQKYIQSFGQDTEILDRFLNCDLLVIDDLGAEPTIKNITAEHIYNIINERLATGKAFLITTNLPPSAIFEKYDQRIASRILSKLTSTVIEFNGSDLRLST